MSTLEEQDGPPPSTKLVFQEKMRRFAALSKRQRELDSDLTAVKAEKAALEETLLDEMAEAGVSNQTTDGMVLYISSTQYASVKDRPKLLEWLRETGAGWAIKTDVAYQTLNSLLRERLEAGEVLPEEIEMKTKYSLRARAK